MKGLYILVALALFIMMLLLSEKHNNNKTSNKNDISNEPIYPYNKKQYLLTKAEKAFFEVLKLAIENKELYICPKVRLADILNTYNINNRQLYFNKIQSKHIDFLLCGSVYLTPLLAIELDDSSHDLAHRKERDLFVEKALDNAKLPLVRIKAEYAYNIYLIREKIEEALSQSKLN